ncbi:FAD-dependent oxidoreductase [Crocosphaera sp. XPORK-15E]|uniref:FAD-dependent oxidoreductase n=1 Tax=Crocosphaera sp. XPORK-15E TaxID=3110247 RepID=UPI002B207C76|nr:FAD-dependent oxidoreductase [Crocosphaera sp. XPORK-15E]MEA5533141.1 FAD-dependent oxidoreductase [Crocosphaera sp. XPORK-15E]
MNYTHIIVGGGVYGCYLALKLMEIAPRAKVLLIEKEPDLLQRASYNNQARIHNGYHYPRSLLTGLRSRLNFPRFIEEFPDCVVNNFEKLYAIGTDRSKVTANQFRLFCQRIGADIKPASSHFQKLFNRDFIEEVFQVKEYAFDAEKLKNLLASRLAQTPVSLLMNTEAIKVIPPSDSLGKGKLGLLLKDLLSGETQELESEYIYNCTYANLNTLPLNSGLELLYLRHEATELSLVKMPDALQNMGLTVMCGPFFSVMPFPAKNLFSFSHVSYTPHYQWSEIPSAENFQQHRPPFPLKSNFERMVRDAARFLPLLSDCSYVDSLWEVKTILPQSDGDDSRPILFKTDSAVPRFISVLGGKIDNIFDLDEALLEHY